MSGGIVHIVHIWGDWMLRAFMWPVLSWDGGLQSSSVPSAPSGHDQSFCVLRLAQWCGAQLDENPCYFDS